MHDDSASPGGDLSGRTAPRRRGGWDVLALAPAAAAVLMAGLYVGLIVGQGDRPVAWFLGGLLGAAALGAFGAARAAPRRPVALLACGVALIILGRLALASIGLPILVAGVLALVAAARARRGAHR